MKKSNYQILGQEQVDQIKTFQNNIRRNTIDLVKYAFDIHTRYISADGKKYLESFETWWNDYSVMSIVGGRSNWTQLHQAGAAISKMETRFNTDTDKLPQSVASLYQISQLTDEEMQLCLKNKYTRKSLTEAENLWTFLKKPKPVISPYATAASIKRWKDNWRSPPGEKQKEKFTLTLAEIKIPGSLYNFTGPGAHSGEITIEEVGEIQKTLDQTFAKMLGSKLVIVSQLEKLTEGYHRNEERAITKYNENVKSRVAKKNSLLTKKK